MNRKRNYQEDSSLEANSNDGKDYQLILYNDDVHDFHYVIESLMDICEHEAVQAEQCTFLVHYTGKCDVRKGKYHHLKTMFDRLVDRGLKVSIN